MRDSAVPPGFCDSAISEFTAKSSKLHNFRKSSQIFIIVSQIFIIVADFGLRRIPRHQRNAHSVKTKLFLSLKKGMNSLAFSYSEESIRICCWINNISVKSYEKHSNSAQNSVKAMDIRTNATDVDTRKNNCSINTNLHHSYNMITLFVHSS